MINKYYGYWEGVETLPTTSSATNTVDFILTAKQIAVAYYKETKKMIKVIKKSINDNVVIEMKDMQPLQVGFIESSKHHVHIGDIVMRTFSTDKHEVMNLSNPNPDSCWCTAGISKFIKVRLLNKGEKILLELSGD